MLRKLSDAQAKEDAENQRRLRDELDAYLHEGEGSEK